jgi:hypothetical protein
MLGLPADHVLDDTDGVASDGLWRASIHEPPPDDHLLGGKGKGTAIAVEIPLAYEHVNRNGMYDSEDIVAGYACYDDVFTALLYLPRVTDIDVAWWLASLDLHLGWLIGQNLESMTPTFLTEDEALDLVLSPDCASPF